MNNAVRTVQSLIPNPQSLPSLSVHRPEEEAWLDPQQPGLRPRLSEWYYGWYRPAVLLSRVGAGSLKTESVRSVDGSLRRFVELMGDLYLEEITREILRAFRSQCQARGMAWATIDKHEVQLEPVLGFAGPNSPRWRDAPTDDGFFGVDKRKMPRPAPWFPRREHDRPERHRGYSPEELGRLLSQAVIEPAPKKLRSYSQAVRESYWRSFFCFVAATGVRYGTAKAACRSWVHEENGQATLWIPPENFKRGRRGAEPKIIYLSQEARAAMQNGVAGDRPWPAPAGDRRFHAILRSIRDRAGIPAEVKPCHGLRTAYLSDLAEVVRSAAQQQAGHADLKTTLDSYVQLKSQARAIVAQVAPAEAKRTSKRRKEAEGQLPLF
jgi:integrase